MCENGPVSSGNVMAEQPVVFAFGDFEADEALRELRRDGRPVELQATPLRLLLYLLRNRDRVISKDELLDRVWSDATVSEGALSTALKEIRSALGDTGSQQRVIQTLRGQGYRVIATVAEHPATAPATSEPGRGPVSRPRQLIQEIHRRSLWQVLGIYLVGAWVAFQGIEALTDGLAMPEWVPGFAVVLMIVGLPIVLATAFVQEGVGVGEAPVEAAATPEAGQATRVANGAGLHLFLTWRNVVLAGALVFGLAGVVAAGWLLLKGETSGSPEAIRSLAVLPFVDLGPGADQEFFARGMTEALITELAKIGSLKVISRTSVLQYEGTLKTAPEIARELRVEGLIEGSVTRDGDEIRITAQLIHGPTDRHLWAETYTGSLTNVLRLQSKLALAITGAVGIVLSPEESSRLGEPGTVDPKAYEAFLLGMYFRDEGTHKGIRTAIRHFERATTLDPDFALAWAGASYAYSMLAGWGFEKPSRVYPPAQRAARRALELAPSLGQGYSALAWLAHAYEWEWGEAERLYRKALELAPGDAQAHADLSWLLMQTGRYPEAVAEAEITLDLDPCSRQVRNDVAKVFDLTGFDRDRARQLREVLFREDPGFVPLLLILVDQRFRDGAPDEAILLAEELARAAPPDARSQLMLALAHAVAGHGERAREIVVTARRTYGEDRLSNGMLAEIHVSLGEIDEAFQAYERAFQEREWPMVWLRVGPYVGIAATFPNWKRFRQDPRYWDLMRRMNFPPFPPEHPGFADEQAQLHKRKGVGGSASLR